MPGREWSGRAALEAPGKGSEKGNKKICDWPGSKKFIHRFEIITNYSIFVLGTPVCREKLEFTTRKLNTEGET